MKLAVSSISEIWVNSLYIGEGDEYDENRRRGKCCPAHQ